ncbi:MAG: glycosyltransferase [Holophagae bacterium]|jgi:glycosyltransferase involved in cell wall biosynthesis
MSKLLILGVSPLPFESTRRSFGPGTRTWQLTEPLVDDGHEVRLIGMRIPQTYPDDAPAEIVDRRGRLTYASITDQLYLQSDYVQRAADELEPDAAIFAHGSASYADGVLTTDVPVWIDVCGHVMAEAQAKAAVYDDDSYVDYFFGKMLGSLFRGDMFSTVSDAQAFALIGELGMAGRLNSHTNGVALVHTIPCGVEEDDYRHDATVLRGVDVGDDDFVVLWSGGFNTWTDVDTMFDGLSRAMDRDPSIHFVATGGQIDGHDEITYPRFVRHIERSPHRDRFHLKGWLPRHLVPNYYFEADVGINCEKDIYEVRLGSKHRILDWSRAALPVVTTRVTELSTAVEDDGVGFVVAAADPEAMADAIIEAASRRHELADIGRRFRDAMRRRYGFRASTAALRDWARSPAAAPDRGRIETCLARLLAPSSDATAVATDGGSGSSEVEPVAPPTAEAEPPPGETRRDWLIRVVRQSYRDGGIPMVVRRAVERVIGSGGSGES